MFSEKESIHQNKIKKGQKKEPCSAPEAPSSETADNASSSLALPSPYWRLSSDSERDGTARNKDGVVVLRAASSANLSFDDSVSREVGCEVEDWGETREATDALSVDVEVTSMAEDVMGGTALLC